MRKMQKNGTTVTIATGIVKTKTLVNDLILGFVFAIVGVIVSAPLWLIAIVLLVTIITLDLLTDYFQ